MPTIKSSFLQIKFFTYLHHKIEKIVSYCQVNFYYYFSRELFYGSWAKRYKDVVHILVNVPIKEATGPCCHIRAYFSWETFYCDRDFWKQNNFG